MRTTRLVVRVDDKLRSRLMNVAQGSGKSLSQIVREALVAHLETLERGESCYDLARRSGLIGCVDNAPSDLSTSRDSFDGFGMK